MLWGFNQVDRECSRAGREVKTPGAGLGGTPYHSEARGQVVLSPRGSGLLADCAVGHHPSPPLRAGPDIGSVEDESRAIPCSPPTPASVDQPWAGFCLSSASSWKLVHVTPHLPGTCSP